MQGYVRITELASESEVVSSLASLCLQSCMCDVLVRIPGLKVVWSGLALVASFAKKYRLDYDQTPHSGHSIARRSRLEVGWDECVPCPVPPLLCREELCLRGRTWDCWSLLTLWGEDLTLVLAYLGGKKIL